MGRWAEANRMPTAGDLHWGAGSEVWLPGSHSQVVLWGTQKQRFHPEGESWACSGVDQGLPSRGHHLRGT